MSDNMEERTVKKVEVPIKRGKFQFDTEDILALAGLVVAIIVAIGMIFGKIDAKSGATILIAICGGAAIAQIIKAKRSRSKEKRAVKGIEVPLKKGRFKFETEDILALAGFVVSIIIAIGMVTGRVGGTAGSAILVPICGGAAIAKVVQAKSSKSKR